MGLRITFPSGPEGTAGRKVLKVPGANSDHDVRASVLEPFARRRFVSFIDGVGDRLRREKVLLVILEDISW